MTRAKMRLIVILMCLAIIGVLLFQVSWLLTSYAVSKKKIEQNIHVLLDAAIVTQKRQQADTVRVLMKRLVRSERDFNYSVFDWSSGTQIGLRGKGADKNYAMYKASELDVVSVKRNSYQFFLDKMNSLKLDELYPMYASLVGQNEYPGNSQEEHVLRKLSASFRPYENITALNSILRDTFSLEHIPFNGAVRHFDDISSLYTKEVKTPARNIKLSPISSETIGVILGSDDNQSLAVKLDLLTIHIDSLNRIGDSIYVAKPILYDVNEMLRSKIPVILLSVKIPTFSIIGNMVTSMIGSFILMIFIGFCVVYMFHTILKQRKLSVIKDDFVSNISHELKTPIATALASVQGLQYFDVLQDPVKTSRYLNTASGEIKRLSLLVDTILNMSIFESNGFALHPTVFNLKEMLAQLLESQQMRTEKPVKLQLNYSAREEISADKTHLFTVLTNLIDNAINYSANQVSIGIECKDTLNGIEIRVIDNGLGIGEESQPYIFDKFFRAPSPNDHRIKGYGLGLNYVKNIIEKHRGSVALEKSDPSGSIFRINLPQL